MAVITLLWKWTIVCFVGVGVGGRGFGGNGVEKVEASDRIGTSLAFTRASVHSCRWARTTVDKFVRLDAAESSEVECTLYFTVDDVVSPVSA
ncbi:Protein of unknown function [Cotesia congregata]|uniref:Secreted protein n=1 Tax=Cotesia congregata TaxID=51543 RepID=A0A8J2HJM6_COTCN|nr:Protein of unknown function [Cotesia congregata]